jgi:hypothetical protein
MAWLKLYPNASRIGEVMQQPFAFSESNNERHEGVSRMRSLSILLEVGCIEVADDRGAEDEIGWRGDRVQTRMPTGPNANRTRFVAHPWRDAGHPSYEVNFARRVTQERPVEFHLTSCCA